MELLKRKRHDAGFYKSVVDYPTKVPRRSAVQPTLNGTFDVERIIAKKSIKGKVHFYVKWKGWPVEQNTWEPSQHIPSYFLYVMTSFTVTSKMTYPHKNPKWPST